MILVIFGASGDLSKRKLFPALSKCSLKNVKIIGYSRSEQEPSFHAKLKEFYSYNDEFLNKVTYVRGLYTDLTPLKNLVDENTVFYFSVPPVIYKTLLEQVSFLPHKCVAIEKPFGRDLNDFLSFKQFLQRRIYFIDHYLIKPMMVVLPSLLKSRSDLFGILNQNFVSHVSIVMTEVLGGEGRSYFDENGVLRDILQNHLAEMYYVSVAEACSREKIFKLTSIMQEFCIYGQYDVYTKELNKDSDTETFATVPLQLNTDRWRGVPFVLTAGKGMDSKTTKIVYAFRKSAFVSAINLLKVEDGYKRMHVNDIETASLVCEVYPSNEIYIEIKFGDIERFPLFDSYTINKCMQQKYGTKTDHEIVFQALVDGTYFNSVEYEEAEALWNLFTPILGIKKNLFYYKKGAAIPSQVEKMTMELQDSK